MTDSELMEHLHARGWRTEAIDVPMIREACRALQPSASAEPVQEPDKWIFDPHDIEQGMMLNPAWLKLHGLTAREAIAASPVTAAREQEASATGAEPVGFFVPKEEGSEWLHQVSKLYAKDPRYAEKGRWLYATPTTSTTGKEEEAFEQLCREHDILGTAADRQCEVFWKAGARFALEQAAQLYGEGEVAAPGGHSQWGDAHQEGWIDGTKAYRDAIRSLIGTPKSAEGEGA
jgi:hypothetical protein